MNSGATSAETSTSAAAGLCSPKYSIRARAARRAVGHVREEDADPDNVLLASVGRPEQPVSVSQALERLSSGVAPADESTFDLFRDHPLARHVYTSASQ